MNGVSRRGSDLTSAAATPVSWHPGTALDLEHWAARGRHLGLMGRGAPWWIGDWLRYGQLRYPDDCTGARETMGYEPHALKSLAFVAARIEAARRHGALSWAHHAAVAGLARADQDMWLELAERERLSARDLGAAVVRTAERLEVGLEDVPLCPQCGHSFFEAM